MDVNKRVELREQEDKLKSLYVSGKIKPGIFAKAMIALALEWADSDECQTALDIVERLPSSYFADDIVAQMRIDPVFAQKAGHLSVVLGLFANHAELVPTQAEAKA